MASAASFGLGEGVLIYMEWSMPELTEQHTHDQMRVKHFGMALSAELRARTLARTVFGSLLCILATFDQLPKIHREDMDPTTISYGHV